MAARLFGGGCLTPDQESAVGTPAIDYSCRVINTCGVSAEILLSQYPLYDPWAGRFLTQWAQIDLPWENSDFRWSSAEYQKQFGYEVGDKVIYLADQGYLLLLLECIEDIPVPVGALDPSKWEEICRIRVSEDIAIPEYSDIVGKYPYYDLSLFLTTWSEFSSDWETDLVDPDSDIWSDSRIRKTFFYRRGDIVLYDSGCSDYTCVYVAKSDMPTLEILSVPGPPTLEYWDRLYCTKNGNSNTCEKKFSCEDRPYRVPVSLSVPDSDLICVPVESTTGIGPKR